MRTNGTGKHTRTDIVHVHSTHILNIPWRWKHTELKYSDTDKFYRVSYFITPFNQKGIYEWESKCVESVSTSGSL